MRNRVLGKATAAGAIVILYFLLLTRRGLCTNFMGDDLMNIAFLHGYGRVPLRVVLAQALSVFSPEYRPMGGLYYRTLFALFGLHPVPFRTAFFALLITNLILAGVWYRRLSHSIMTAAAATLIYSFHPALAELYYDNATIYDVLCVLFILLLLSCYVRIRQENRFVAGNNLLLVLALYGAALGSKEMAFTLPAVLVLYEVIFHPGWPELCSRFWPISLLALMSVVCMAIKILVPNQMSINPGYAPQYQLAFIGNSYLHYYRLLLLNDGLTASVLTGMVIFALLVAVVLRNRLMVFGLLFANLTLIPVCLILPRAGFVWYMPLLGYALYGGAAVSLLTDKLLRMAPSRARYQVQATVFAALVVVSYVFHLRHARNLETSFLPEQRQLQAMLTAAKAAAPTLAHGSRVLMETDPYREIWWWPLFLIRLGYQDSTIWVERVSHLGDNYNPRDVSLYDMRMRWDGSQYQVVTQPQTGAPPVAFDVTPVAVRRGQTARIHLLEPFANCAIDVAYRMPEDELMRGGVWLHWTQLDAAGSGVVRVDVDAERGLVVIDRVRACGGTWMPARASFVTAP